MSIQTIVLEPTDQFEFSLRRYRSASDSGNCPSTGWIHDASTKPMWRGKAETAPKVDEEGRPVSGDVYPHVDPCWPKECGCGYKFTDDDHWQFNAHQLYRRSDTGELTTLRAAPVGSMWRATWMESPGKRHWSTWMDKDAVWVCRLPHDHDWIIGMRAANCDSPCKSCGKPYHAHKDDRSHSYEDSRPHKCWVAHGEPPYMHVDKNGVTCGAGAGSIATPKWHGFLHHGKLRG